MSQSGGPSNVGGPGLIMGSLNMVQAPSERHRRERVYGGVCVARNRGRPPGAESATEFCQ